MDTQIYNGKVDENDNAKKSGGWWRPVLLIGVIVVIIILSKVFHLGDRIGDLRDWIQGLGTMGPVVFVALYIVAVVAALPGSALTLASGALFGSIVGVILVSIASTIGASLAFLVSRYFARDSMAQWLSKKETFAKLDRMTGEHGAVIVALTRLVPIFPFNILNYGFGLTKVRFWTYVFWSWLCMLPGTVLYVVGADAFSKGLSEGRVPWPLIGVVIAVFGMLALIAKYARKMLKEKEADANPA